MGVARRRVRWPLVGRATELEGVTAALSRGGAVIGGPPGIGRTRLATEIAERTAATERPVHRMTGSAVTADVPFGAAAHLLPAHLLPPGTAGAALLVHAVAALGSGRPLLMVDDAHLLDPLTVGVLDQLVRTDAATLVATVPDGADDPLAALWGDDVVARVELGPLGADDVDLLLRRALDGPVAGRTRELVGGWSRGVPRALREIVEGGREDGSLTRHDGLWEWSGPLRPTARLVRLTTAPLAGLDRDGRAALDLLAVAGPLPLPRLVGLAGRAAVAGLERAGLVGIRRPVDRPGAQEVGVVDPLLAIVLAAILPAAEAGTLRRRVAETATGEDPDDVLRTGRMLLDGEATDVAAEPLAAAAGVALERGDHALARRLATAAGPAGTAVLTEALAWLGHPADADTVGRTAPDSPRMRAVRALNAELGLHRSSDALLDDPADDTGLQRAARAVIALHRAEPERAAALGQAVLDDPAARAGHPLAAAATGIALAIGGRDGPARDAVAAGLAALGTPEGAAGPALGRLACEHAHRLTRLHLGEVADPGDPGPWTDAGAAGQAVAALHRGGTALAAGHAAEAAELLVEAVHGLDRTDPLDLHVLGDAWLATALALAGRLVEARDRLDRIPGTVTAFQVHVDRARVWVEAGVDPVAAAGTALAAAERAAVDGAPVGRAYLLHDALRIGALRTAQPPDVAGSLHDLAATVGLPVVRAAAEHAAGLDAADPERVLAAADRFEALGALLRAADAAAQAAELHRSLGNRRRSAAATARATGLAQRCGGPVTPALAALATPRLTGREADVARLAAGGLSNQMIARRLVVSVRTVETHLAHAYAKLGVGGRGELPGVLPPE